MDIRLSEVPFIFEGREFTLRCNMNVLIDVQEANGGSLDSFLEEKNHMKSVALLLASMLNDDAEERGYAVRYTPRQLGRKLSLREYQRVDRLITDLLLSAVNDETAATEEQTEKNWQTSKGSDAVSPSAGT